MKNTRLTLFLGDLLGCEIVTAEGKVLGHVADIQLSQGPVYSVIALLYGEQGWLYRWHVLNPFKRGVQRPEPKKIPWSAVASFQQPVVRLKAGYEEREE